MRQWGMARERDELAVPRTIWGVIPPRLIRRSWAFPIALEERLPRARLRVAMLDPRDLALADEIAFATGLEVVPVAMAPEPLRRLIKIHLGEEPDPDRLPRSRTVRVEAIELPENTGPEAELDAESWLVR
jgi:hypothetical protein